MADKKPDKHSMRFMAWAVPKLDDPIFYAELIESINQDADRYFSSNRNAIKRDLFQKLWNGAIEHGEPFYDLDWIEKEMEKELIDLIGYKLLYIWNEEQK